MTNWNILPASRYCKMFVCMDWTQFWLKAHRYKKFKNATNPSLIKASSFQFGLFGAFNWSKRKLSYRISGLLSSGVKQLLPILTRPPIGRMSTKYWHGNIPSKKIETVITRILQIYSFLKFIWLYISRHYAKQVLVIWSYVYNFYKH